MKWDVHLASSMWRAPMHYVLLLLLWWLFWGTGTSGLFAGCISGTTTQSRIDSNVKITSHSRKCYLYIFYFIIHIQDHYIWFMCQILLISTPLDLEDNALYVSALHGKYCSLQFPFIQHRKLLCGTFISPLISCWFQHKRMKRLEMCSRKRGGGAVWGPLYIFFKLEISLLLILDVKRLAKGTCFGLFVWPRGSKLR